MTVLSIYDARLAAVVADAEAYTALHGAMDKLARHGMVDRAFTLRALLGYEMERPGVPRWRYLSGVVERLGQRNESGAVSDDEREQVGEVLVELYDAINRAWEARLTVIEILEVGDQE